MVQELASWRADRKGGFPSFSAVAALQVQASKRGRDRLMASWSWKPVSSWLLKSQKLQPSDSQMSDDPWAARVKAAHARLYLFSLVRVVIYMH